MYTCDYFDSVFDDLSISWRNKIDTSTEISFIIDGSSVDYYDRAPYIPTADDIDGVQHAA